MAAAVAGMDIGSYRFRYGSLRDIYIPHMEVMVPFSSQPCENGLY